MATIGVHVASADPVLRAALKPAIGADAGLVLRATSDGLAALLESLPRVSPPVLLLDHALVDAGDDALLATLHALAPGCAVILIGEAGVVGEPARIMSALAAGVRGVLDRQSAVAQCAKACRQVGEGDLWIPRVLMARMLTGLLPRPAAAGPRERLPSPEGEALTEREVEIADAVVRGLSNREIGERLGISEMTVKTHLHRTFAKLGLQRRTQLIAASVRAPVPASRP